MKGREIRDALHHGRRVYATALIAPGPHFPEVVKEAQADFVFIDTEHTPLGRETLIIPCRIRLLFCTGEPLCITQIREDSERSFSCTWRH